ncbi:MAG: hypothetical protein ABR905_12460, partial [Terracidiphilus sp.]
LPQSQLPAPESATARRHKNPTRRLSESRVKRCLLHFLVKSRIYGLEAAQLADASPAIDLMQA